MGLSCSAQPVVSVVQTSEKAVCSGVAQMSPEAGNPRRDLAQICRRDAHCVALQVLALPLGQGLLQMGNHPPAGEGVGRVDDVPEQVQAINQTAKLLLGVQLQPKRSRKNPSI